MNFIMADLMQEHRSSTLAAPEARNKMMQALWRIGWDRTTAKGTNRLILVHHAGPFLIPTLALAKNCPVTKGLGDELPTKYQRP